MVAARTSGPAPRSAARLGSPQPAIGEMRIATDAEAANTTVHATRRTTAYRGHHYARRGEVWRGAKSACAQPCYAGAPAAAAAHSDARGGRDRASGRYAGAGAPRALRRPVDTAGGLPHGRAGTADRGAARGARLPDAPYGPPRHRPRHPLAALADAAHAGEWLRKLAFRAQPRGSGHAGAQRGWSRAAGGAPAHTRRARQAAEQVVARPRRHVARLRRQLSGAAGTGAAARHLGIQHARAGYLDHDGSLARPPARSRSVAGGRRHAVSSRIRPCHRHGHPHLVRPARTARGNGAAAPATAYLPRRARARAVRPTGCATARPRDAGPGTLPARVRQPATLARRPHPLHERGAQDAALSRKRP